MTFAEFERLFFLKLDQLLEKLKRERDGGATQQIGKT